jgi:serine/threonine protein phosphatase PrpC
VTSFLNKLFHKKPPLNTIPSKLDVASEHLENIKPDLKGINPTEQGPSIFPPKTHLDVPQLIVGVAQSIGIQRDHNEDSLFTLTTNLIMDDKTINFGLYIVADGMGGHDDGELASSLAVGTLASHVINNLYLPLISASNDKLEFSIQEVMQAGVKQAHQVVKKGTDGGGTTLTAALILGDQITLTHVGDSRAYSIDPDGYMKLLTHDHSMVKRLEEIGQISPEQALTHPQRNVLYRALGQGEPFEPDVASFQVCQGCQLLLCSDGLWGVVPDDKLADITRSSSEPQLGCQSLIHLANEAGGPDNISVIIVQIPV